MISLEAVQNGVLSAIPAEAWKILSFFDAVKDTYGNVTPLSTTSHPTATGPLNIACGVSHRTALKWIDWLVDHGLLVQVTAGTWNTLYGVYKGTGRRGRAWHMTYELERCADSDCPCQVLKGQKCKLYTFAPTKSADIALLPSPEDPISAENALNGNEGISGSDTRKLSNSGDSNVFNNILITDSTSSSDSKESSEATPASKKRKATDPEFAGKKDLLISLLPPDCVPDHAQLGRVINTHWRKYALTELNEIAPALIRILNRVSGYQLVCDIERLMAFAGTVSTLAAFHATPVDLQRWIDSKRAEHWTDNFFTLASVRRHYAPPTVPAPLLRPETESEADRRRREERAQLKADLQAMKKGQGQ